MIKSDRFKMEAELLRWLIEWSWKNGRSKSWTVSRALIDFREKRGKSTEAIIEQEIDGFIDATKKPRRGSAVGQSGAWKTSDPYEAAGIKRPTKTLGEVLKDRGIRPKSRQETEAVLRALEAKRAQQPANSTPDETPPRKNETEKDESSQE